MTTTHGNIIDQALLGRSSSGSVPCSSVKRRFGCACFIDPKSLKDGVGETALEDAHGPASAAPRQARRRSPDETSFDELLPTVPLVI